MLVAGPINPDPPDTEYSCLDSIEGLTKIGNLIIGIFDSYRQQFRPGSGDSNSGRYASDAEELTLTVTMSRSWYCWWVSELAT